MQQIKIFKGVENDVSGLQEEVNHWIRQTGARIISITGNIAPQSESGSTSGSLGGNHFASSDVLLIVLYEVAS